MPWRDASPMDQRTQFIADYLRDSLAITELCELYGISRKTGYKWIERYLRYLGLKARKRTIAEDRRALKHLKAAFGEATLLTDLTADRISKYKARRLATTRTIGGTEKPLSAAAVNRPLALLRHLLRPAHDEWGVLDRVPKIRTEKEPQGRSGGSRGSRRPTCWPPAVRARTRHWPTSWSSACSRACAEVRRSRSLGIGSTAREASSAWS